MSESFVRVGKMKDAHGIRGELFVVFFGGTNTDWIDDLKELRLVVENGEPNPKTFTIKSARAHKNGMIVKTHELKDRNEAEALKGRLLEIPEAMLVSAPGEALYLREILDFAVVTKAQGEVGNITGFSSNVAQDLLVVKTAGGVFEIPFVKAFVENIDHAAKRIYMDLPYGLLGEDLGADQPEPSAGQSHEDDQDDDQDDAEEI